MISKIISRAACLRELASNPKSFSNCPDLHGGVPDLPEDRICLKPAVGKKQVGPPAICSACALKFAYALGPACIDRIHGKNSRLPISTCRRLACVLVTCSLAQRNKPNSYSSYKTKERE